MKPFATVVIGLEPFKNFYNKVVVKAINTDPKKINIKEFSLQIISEKNNFTSLKGV